MSHAEEEGNLQAIVRINNRSNNTQNREISLYTEEKLFTLKEVQLGPKEVKTVYFDKIITQLKVLIELDPKKEDGHLLMGKTYFNEAAALQDEMKAIKGTTPADTQKKTDLKKRMEERMKEALPHLEYALSLYEAMSAEQLKDRRMKNEYKTTLYLLTDAYRFLGNTEKEKFYDKKYQALNQ